MSSPWVERNLDGAQYAQWRGSQYEGPTYFHLDGEREYHDRALDEWRENALVTRPSIRTNLGWAPDFWVAIEAACYAIATLGAWWLLDGFIFPVLRTVVS